MQNKTITEKSSGEIIIKKSKFISFLHPIETVEQAKVLLNSYQKEYKDARHICYAYVLNKTSEKYFDDGEPSGTAGLPILNYLKQKNLVNVLCVVVRYFGGVKLGAGGLIRAYKNATKKSYENAKVINYKKYKTFVLSFPYEKMSSFNKLTKEKWYEIKKIKYNEKVQITIAVEEGYEKAYLAKFKNFK